jgi:hypothetical protein
VLLHPIIEHLLESLISVFSDELSAPEEIIKLEASIPKALYPALVIESPGGEI